MTENLELYNNITKFVSQAFVDRGIDIAEDENGWKINIEIQQDYFDNSLYTVIVFHWSGVIKQDVKENNYEAVLGPIITKFIDDIPNL